jgi:Actinobacteria/chloroflexi VLRF1 release factor
VGNPAAGGGRWVEVAPERFVAWAGDFGKRHGQLAAETGTAVVTLIAADGSRAECHVPFPPMTSRPPACRPTGPVPGEKRSLEGSPGLEEGTPPPGLPDPGEGSATAAALIAEVAAHSRAERTVAVLLVRLGGYAAGVFAGSPAALIASKTGSRLVHGRSAAGGWSQHRFARRREKQAAEALDAAADAALRVFGPYQSQLQAVVLGGDRRTVAGLRDDPRLRPYLALATERFLTVPDPRLAVLRDTPRLFRAIKVRVSPGGRPPGPPAALRAPLR